MTLTLLLPIYQYIIMFYFVSKYLRHKGQQDPLPLLVKLWSSDKNNLLFGTFTGREFDHKVDTDLHPCGHLCHI